MSKKHKVVYFKCSDVKQIDVFEEVQINFVDLNLNEFLEDLFNREEIGITTTDTEGIIQIKTPIALIKWDLDNKKEFESLYNYRDCYDDENCFVNTGFKIPVSNLGRI